MSRSFVRYPSSAQRRGFSRIETLLLGSTVALCTVWLWPVAAQSGANTAESVQRAACQSNLKRVGLGIMQYVQDYDERYPPVAADNGKGHNHDGWADVIEPYTKNSALLQCPSEKHADIVSSTQPGFTDYWYNRNLAGKPLASINYVANTLMLGDGDGGSAASTSRYAISTFPALWLKTPHSPARRHLDAGNYAFADGHVKGLTPTKLPGKQHSSVTFDLN